MNKKKQKKKTKHRTSKQQTNGTHTHTHAHAPEPVYGHEDVTALRNQGVRADRLRQIGQV